MVRRYDLGKLDKLRTLPAGGARIPATIGRTGVQTYTDASGKAIREYRPPSEVFSDAALESLRGATVTIQHPQEFVDSKSWADLAVGTVSDTHAQPLKLGAYQFVKTDLLIFRDSALEDIAAEPPRLVEISAGYTATIDPTPGISPEGEAYDVIQRDIRYNHVALLGPGQARAGKDARLRLDGSQEFICDVVESESMKELQEALDRAAKAEAELATERKRADKAEADLAATKAERDAANARADAEKQRADGEKQRADSLPSVEKLVSEELAFRTDALRDLPKGYDFAGKSRIDVKKDLAKALGGTPKEDATAEYLDVYIAARRDARKEDYNALQEPLKEKTPEVSIASKADEAFAKSWKK